MAKSPSRSDLTLILRGLGKISSAALEVYTKEVNKVWSNSSLKPITEETVSSFQDVVIKSSLVSEADVRKNVSETFGRLSVVGESIKSYFSGIKHVEDLNEEDVSGITFGQFPDVTLDKDLDKISKDEKLIEGIYGKEEKEKILENFDSDALSPQFTSPYNLAQIATDTKVEIESRINQFEPLLRKPVGVEGEITEEQIEAISGRLSELQGSEFKKDIDIHKEIHAVSGNVIREKSESIPLKSDTGKKLTPQHIIDTQGSINTINLESKYEDTSASLKGPKLIGNKPLAKDKAKSTLSSDAQARKVPQSRIGRLVSFGGLAAGLGMGTLAEITRRTLGVKKPDESGALFDSSPFLTEANARRIVDTLCKVRGAALKLGQMLSIQDNSLINPELQKVFERVRQSADFMPTWQLERTLVKDFGSEWRTLVSSFDDRPFAAASIGQVHQAILHDGRAVAMKIQYPGVAEGIESDINNLISTLNMANVLPEGMYMDSLIEVAKKELRWECDYVREKECTQRFRRLLEQHSEYYVPEVIEELCTKQVFTTELIDGIPVDKCTSLDQETRNYIASLVLRLCLMEVFEFGFMQTDPNWSNFFYNKETEQLALLDFGACREYSKEFVDKYINIIHGAASKDRAKVEEFSKELGFLTGYEAKVMVKAHVDAVMILGEAFQHDRPFSFGHQDTTRRVQQLVPVMLSHRMCPPPEESYSLHRKMSGVFLLCAKLDAAINCKPFFDNLWRRYRMGGTWDTHRAGLQTHSSAV